METVINTQDDANYWRFILARNTRNSILQSTDKYLLADYPITPENLEKIKIYRQMLRDIININKEAILTTNFELDIPPIPEILPEVSQV
jgi:hypothetical protein